MCFPWKEHAPSGWPGAGACPHSLATRGGAPLADLLKGPRNPFPRQFTVFKVCDQRSHSEDRSL